mmetsp:Transcript_9257/g.22931  ORF Transcript_9257/g.22931 Transcript_9257/m.22931 type:complete len:218 (+) Transcript_9257:2279-2932(+)
MSCQLRQPARCVRLDSITTRVPPSASPHPASFSPGATMAELLLLLLEEVLGSARLVLPEATAAAAAAARRARCSPSSRCAMTQWPRKLTWNCASSPSRVTSRAAGDMTPALATSRCSGSPRALNALQNMLTLASDAMSTVMTSTLPAPAPGAWDRAAARATSAAAASPRSLERHARMTWAPREVSSSAVALPMPALPPVTMHTLPSKVVLPSAFSGL